VLLVCLALAACGPLPEKTSFAPPDPSPLEKRFADNPNDAQVNLELGDQSEQRGDLLRAEQYFLRAEALGLKADVIVPRLVRVLVASKRYDEALDRCQQRLSRMPDDRATRFVAAALLAGLERPKDAERELQVLVKTRPEDPQPYLALARLYREGDRVLAKEMFEKYLQLAPDGADAAHVRFEIQELGP